MRQNGLALFFILSLCAFSLCPSALALSVSQPKKLSSTDRVKMTGVSWHPGCPVSLHDLRRLKVRYWGPDQHYHTGVIVVHRNVAAGLASIMAILARHHFTIASIRPIEAFGGSDYRSAAANNTSAFNCRLMTNSLTHYSKHSEGTAIDINPLWNPYVKGNQIIPHNGKPYVHRRRRQSGLIHHDDLIVKLFKGAGWQWGGDWHSLKDYQHFEKTLNP